ncbi:MAG: phosphoglycerate dehydrogenase [Acidobacteria bacterium]|nr:phosphoglycerate dehydrogenase [Acidobacteriota bacterium]
MKIVIADELPNSAAEVLAEPGWQIERLVRVPRTDLIAALSDTDALIVRSATKVDKELLEHAPRLRVVARAGTGVDNVDVAAASARGILVMNSPGANSVSVAEHALALMLAATRSVARADSAMKSGRWAKRDLSGAELRGKTLGLVGLGRIGQEVALRARAFGMTVLAYDPFIAAQVATDFGVELASLDELCARAEYISLHVPSTAATRRLFDRDRLARCKPGAFIINTARGDLIDEAALAEAIERGHIGGAGLDVYEQEPPRDWHLTSLPQVVATPHIAASTVEAQEQVGLEIASSVREFLHDGTIRNAVNFPALSAEEFGRMRPFARLAQDLASLLAQIGEGRMEGFLIHYSGEIARAQNEVLLSAALVGLLAPILSTTVTFVNARALAAERGVEVIESRSSRIRNFQNLLAMELRTSAGTRRVEGTVFDHGSARIVRLDGVEVEAPLEGTLIVMSNDDQPGVIGEVGTILGRHAINIGTFALGRETGRAAAVVSVDETPEREGDGRVTGQVLEAIRAVRAVREAKVVRL